MSRLDIPIQLRKADAVIVVPPFSRLEYPSLAVHLLQACARRAGFEVSVFYANLLWARRIGEEYYESICRDAPNDELVGERMFARAAFGRNPAAPAGDRTPATAGRIDFDRAQQRAVDWADAVARFVCDREFPVVGSTVTFEQTAASVAVLNRVKELRPETTTIIGGGNCEGEMADGMASLGAQIDFIFRGESEHSFVRFLQELRSEKPPAGRIVEGQPCFTLDELPTPDFSEYFDQYGRIFGTSRRSPEELWMLYESSRGCWWGQKQHCTFCGFNGVTMQFREKSGERVLVELKQLVSRHPTRRICMADNIMPFRYFKTLLPRIADELPELEIYYEEKANLSLDKVLALKRAGLHEIQAGVESLSTPLLERMRKGVSAPQNVAMLRYARSVGVYVNWSLLHDFPGDRVEDYDETLALIPLLRHLHPPTGLHSLTLDRFCPYYDDPEGFGISRVRPLPGYREVFPAHADLPRLAYHFRGDYRSASRERPDVIQAIRDELEVWRAAWNDAGEPPVLELHRHSDTMHILLDRRGLPGIPEVRFLNREQTRQALVPGRVGDDPGVEWALAGRLAVILDDRYVPLATADPELLLEFEGERLRPRRPTAPEPRPSPVPSA